MNLIAQYDVMLQIFAAFLIFVACYLGFVLFTVFCLFIADMISGHLSAVQAYGAKSRLEIDGGSEGAPRKPGELVRAFQHHAAK